MGTRNVIGSQALASGPTLFDSPDGLIADLSGLEVAPVPASVVRAKAKGLTMLVHLWPAWFPLIRECRPGTVFGEQVAAAIGHGWLDLVCGDMEAEEYAIAAAVLGAHSAGAPHIRQRLYFCAHAGCTRGARGLAIRPERPDTSQGTRQFTSAGVRSVVGERADTADARRDNAREHGSRPSLFAARPEQCGGTSLSYDSKGESVDGALFTSEREALPKPMGSGDAIPCSKSMHAERWPVMLDGRDGRDGKDDRRAEAHSIAGTRGEVFVSGDTPLGGFAMRGSTPGNAGHAARTSEPVSSHHTISARLEGHFGDVREWRGPGWLDPLTARSVAEAGATRGFWADCDWWYGRDGRYRPIEPGIFPLVNGAAARVLALRVYGDAICPEVAAAFIESANEAISNLGAL